MCGQHSQSMDQPGMVTNPTRGQLNRKHVSVNRNIPSGVLCVTHGLWAKIILIYILVLCSSVIHDHLEPAAPTPRTTSLSRIRPILQETFHYTTIVDIPDGKGVPPLHEWIDQTCL